MRCAQIMRRSRMRMSDCGKGCRPTGVSWRAILSLLALCYFTLWLYLSCLPLDMSPARSERDTTTVTLGYDENSTAVIMVDEPIVQLQTNNSLTALPKLGSRSKSIVFLKTYKVGGTTLSTILTALAFNSNLKLAPIDDWCSGRGTFTRDGLCVDMIGTGHPRRLPCNFPHIDSDSLCNSAETFMILRDPVDRLWSGYRHEVKIAQTVFPLKRFLKSKSIVKTPSNFLLGMDTTQALKKAESVNIMLHHMYDESLVYMATRTGLKLCDIMYPPCDSAGWSATKCNPNTTVNMTSADRAALTDQAEKTGEKRFYDNLTSGAESKLNTDHIRTLTAKYRTYRSKALLHCKKPGVLDIVISYIKSHPYVIQDRKGEKLYHFQTEKSNPLDPLTICLGWFCHEGDSRKRPSKYREWNSRKRVTPKRKPSFKPQEGDSRKRAPPKRKPPFIPQPKTQPQPKH